jgi:hypothetical protein
MKKITCVVDNTAQRSSLFWGEHTLAHQSFLSGLQDDGCTADTIGFTLAIYRTTGVKIPFVRNAAIC